MNNSVVYLHAAHLRAGANARCLCAVRVEKRAKYPIYSKLPRTHFNYNCIIFHW